MSSPLEQIWKALDQETLETLGSQVGAPTADVEKGLAAALPMLLGGLARNAQSTEGASALASALDRDHDGSLLDDLSGFLSAKGASGTGNAILGHVLGGRQPRAEQAVSRASGLDPATVSRLLALVAPIALAALGKAKREQRLDPSGLSELLGREQERVARAEPRVMDVIGGLLDQDGDGSAADDVADLGASLLGSLFKR